VVLGRPPLGRAVKNLWFAWAVEKRLRQQPYDVVIGLSRTWNQDILRVGGGPQDIFNRLTLAAHGEGLARLGKRLRRTFSPSAAVIRWMEAKQFDAPANPDQRIVCVSHLVRDWLLQAHPGLDPARVGVVYNRPDLSRFTRPSPERRAELRAHLGLTDADTVVCTAGTNFALKGVGTLIRALALLPENFRLAVAGGRHPGAWIALAKSLGVASRVRFAGKVDDMPGFYAGADVFALPSYYDACSNAVLEALACGLPAISSSRNGSAVFVDPRLVLPDPGDATTLARLIALAAAEKDRPAFSWPDDRPCGLPPYLDMVDEIIRQKRGRP
jgi:UDP-glucose:(heptosyl)LPS alpha-1,3-glucosyltransferase